MIYEAQRLSQFGLHAFPALGYHDDRKFVDIHAAMSE
jgi:hypothetical protein